MSFLTAPFDFCDIVSEISRDPRGFIAECDHALAGKIMRAAARIASEANKKPIVLLSGPSGSGKTTTAGKLAQELGWMGVRAHVISMDDYFRTVDPNTHPRDAKGDIDFESPLCMDIPLMREHFQILRNGGEALIPSFNFHTQSRNPREARPLRLGKDEVAVFEGIHALNPTLLDSEDDKTRVYASARANIRRNREIIYKGTWIRLTRRLIRDDNFRSWPADTTMRLWANVRRGEKSYISPYKDLADIQIDTALAYEIPALRDHALPLFTTIPDDAERAGELREVREKLAEFPSLPEAWVNKRSLLREFIGGGIL